MKNRFFFWWIVHKCCFFFGFFRCLFQQSHYPWNCACRLPATFSIKFAFTSDKGVFEHRYQQNDMNNWSISLRLHLLLLHLFTKNLTLSNLFHFTIYEMCVYYIFWSFKSKGKFHHQKLKLVLWNWIIEHSRISTVNFVFT